MMPTYFVIKEFIDGYEWFDFSINDLGLEYSTQTLQIPQECIENVECISPNTLAITLFEDKSILKEDWFHTLLPYAA